MSDVPSRYKRFNTQQTKQLCIALQIDGVPDVLTSAPLYTRIKFGDPIKYGDAGLVYGGLRPYTTASGGTYKNLISMKNSSTALSQRLESESGRASIANISLAFVDQDGYIANLFTPGAVVTDIMGREAIMYVGYSETSYPDDYVAMFRGTITSINMASATGTIQISDPNIKRKQEFFFSSKAKLDNPIDDSQTNMTIPSGISVLVPITDDLGNTDSSVTTYLKIEDEYIKYVADGSSTLAITRAQRGTAAAAHASGVDVSTCIQLEGTAIDLALKIMLSGWGESWTDKLSIASFGTFPDSDPTASHTNLVVLPVGTDAVRDFNLQEGDFFEFFAPMPKLPFIAKVVAIGDLGEDSNRLITIDQSVAKYNPGTAPSVWTYHIRSQYDVLPTELGMKLKPTEVDIAEHQFLNTTFQSVSDSQYSFFLTDTESSGKDFLEQEIYRPAGLFSLTRRGLCSVGISKPPIADETLVILSADNVINPINIKPTRQVNGRTFYNDVDFSYDPDDDGNFQQIYRTTDSDSLNEIGLFSPLTIEARGVRAATTDTATLDRIAKFILSRYKRGQVTFPISVQWGAGNLIEAGDTVAVSDGGNLKIPNFFSSDRYFGIKLFEVTQRNLDIPNGKVDLVLGAGVGAEASDRFATISPSSIVGDGSTTSRIVITDSYGAIFPGNEQGKWTQYLGEKVLFHSEDWDYQETVTLLGFDANFPYVALVDPPLSVPPSAGIIMDIEGYPQSSDPNEAEIYKQIHVFLDRSMPITAVTNNAVFSVAIADAAFIDAGQYIRVHDDDYTNDSGDVKVLSVDPASGLVTLEASLAFTPTTSMLVELGHFDDDGGAYRFI